MAGRRGYFVPLQMLLMDGEELAARQEELFAACPGAAEFGDEEVEDFLAATVYFDAYDHKRVVEGLRRGRIPVPLHMVSSPYLLGRHILSQWRNPDLRQAFFQHVERQVVDFSFIAKLRRRGIGELLSSAERYLSPAFFSVLRRHGMSDVIPQLVAAFSPTLTARHRALLLHGKMLLHRLLTEPQPARPPLRQKRPNLTRRLRLRDAQLHTMRRSVHALSRERVGLLGRVRSAFDQEHPELAALTAEAKQLRNDLAETERRYHATMQEQSQQYQAEMDTLRAELALLQQDFADTLALRGAWLAPLGR
jgi:hypothetical protein